jgi:DNA-binding response OmpR family regulator
MHAPTDARGPAEPPSEQHRVLVVEDDALQAESLQFILQQEGYQVDVVATAEAALAQMRGWRAPDLVLLDVALPDLSGVAVVRRLRAFSGVPVIMVTARRRDDDKVVGLDAGADDYVTKPFNPNELLARVRAHLRRRAREGIGEGAAAREILAVGGLRVDLSTRRVIRDGQPLDLSAREFEIVRLLAEGEGKVVPRQELFDIIWGPGFYGDERALDVYVRTIRKKIEPDPSRPRYLHTVRGVGYRLADEPSDDLGAASDA